MELLPYTLPHTMLMSHEAFFLHVLNILRGWGSVIIYFTFSRTAFLSRAYKDIVNFNFLPTPLSSAEAPSVEKGRKKEGKGRKTGEIKNRGRAGNDESLESVPLNGHVLCTAGFKSVDACSSFSVFPLLFSTDKHFTYLVSLEV